MTEVFRELYTKREYKIPDGTNLLTEELKKQGCRPEDSSTWPEDVFSSDGKRFLYRMDWVYVKYWEAPCGMQTKDHGQWWGELHAEGQYFCGENGNPLFGCPWPKKPCPHRKERFPGSINCQFHRIPPEAYDEGREIQKIEQERIRKIATVRDRDLRTHEGYVNVCQGMEIYTDAEGNEKIRYKWRMSNCQHCMNTVCPARGWAPRNIQKANIYYDVYMEREEENGLVPIVTKKLYKGLRVFDKPIAWTDAEFALKIWQKDPGSVVLPTVMRSRLEGYDRHMMGRNEDYFLVHHGEYDGKRYVLRSEMRNMRVDRQEQKDMLADLQAIREGIEVIHDSDLRKAAETQKSESRKQAKIEKDAKMLAKAMRSGGKHSLPLAWKYQANQKDSDAVKKRKADTLEAIKSRAAEIVENEEKKERLKAQKGEQISLEDLLGEKHDAAI